MVYDIYKGKSTKQTSVLVTSPDLSDTKSATASLSSSLADLDKIQDPQKKIEQISLLVNQISEIDLTTE